MVVLQLNCNTIIQFLCAHACLIWPYGSPLVACAPFPVHSINHCGKPYQTGTEPSPSLNCTWTKPQFSPIWFGSWFSLQFEPVWIWTTASLVSDMPWQNVTMLWELLCRIPTWLWSSSSDDPCIIFVLQSGWTKPKTCYSVAGIGKEATSNLSADVSKVRGANPKFSGNDEINTFCKAIWQIHTGLHRQSHRNPPLRKGSYV